MAQQSGVEREMMRPYSSTAPGAWGKVESLNKVDLGKTAGLVQKETNKYRSVQELRSFSKLFKYF